MYRIFAFYTILLCFTSASFSEEKGKGGIGGTVVDPEENRPVIGANIMLRGTVLGTTTDVSGKFVMENLPAGNYRLIISMVGYKKEEISLTVLPGKRTYADVNLESSAIETEPVVISASRREQSLQEVPVSVSVIDERAILSRNTITVDDALRYVPGVNITHSQVNIRGSTGYSHGAGTRVLLLIDGMPFLTGDTEEIIWESIPTSQIERIEIVKGAGSALYGSSALGGVINVVTKSTRDKAETKVRTYGGMYDSPKYTLWQWSSGTRTFSGIYANHERKIGNAGVVLGGSRTVDDGYKRNDFWKRWNAWTRIGYDISPYRSVSFSFNILDQRRANFLYWKDLEHALEPPDDQLDQRVESIRWNLGGSYREFISDNFYSTVKINWSRSRWRDNIPSQSFPSGTNSFSDFWTADFQSNYQLSETNYCTFGISANYNRVIAASIFGIHHSRGSAVYFQYELGYFKNLILSAGGRFDIQKLGNTGTVSQFNPKLGAVYRPAESTALRISAGRGFRVPSVAEVYTNTDAGGLIIRPNPSLRPERSWSFEIGAFQSFCDRVSADISFFRNELWDLIEAGFGSDNYIHFHNVTRARITGAEISVNTSLADKLLQSQVSYTYVYPEDVDKGTVLNHRQRHLFYFLNEIRLGPVSLGIDYRYISRMENIDVLITMIIPDGDRRVACHFTDLRLIADWNFAGIPVVSAFHVNNLFQYYYTDFIGNIAPLRNYVLTLETRL